MFHIHRSERADALVDALVDVVAPPLDDPFAAEVVAVPTRGVERWLTHRIGAAVGVTPGRADGVCANVAFPFPGRLVGGVLAVATGVDRDQDPWRPERLVWPVLSVLDECAGEEWSRLLGSHLGAGDGRADGHDDLRRQRRYPAARHVAELFDRYAVYRPELVLGWLDRDPADDRHDPDLPADARWQPELLRRVRAHLGVPSPPERVARACQHLRAGDVDLDLPGRLSLFGLTRLPATYLEVLRALATHRDVHLFALHPSLPLWDRIAELDLDPVGLRRAEDPTRALPRHPLLGTWAHDSREMQVVLAATAEDDVAHRPSGPPVDDTLLHRLQADVRADVEPVPPRVEPGWAMAPDDRSVQVHACHGRTRQVEVLRDAIGHLLAADPTLEPRDVIVLCPDIDEFAPLLHATFGTREDDAADVGPTGLPHLPYRLADRSLRRTNPLLAALDDLLALVDGRLTTTEVLRFAGRPPVRRRFGLDDDALDRVAGWVEDAGVRWGLDAAHRAPWALDAVGDHTWRAGLDRLLLGVTMDEDDARTVGDRLPLDDVDSGDVDLAGRVAELVDRLAAVVDGCRTARPLRSWVDLLGEATDLLLAPPAEESWQRVQVDGVLGEALAEATVAGAASDRSLGLAEVRALLGGKLAGVPTRADFRTGAITMCTLVPMRAVPHRVVCVLGLDDGAFPRTGRVDGDDLLQRDPWVGDREPRTEDRQLLLDAVLSATETLVVTYTGRDERTNEPRPPSVPLHELLAVLDRTASAADGTPAGRAVVTDHPLQPFDRRVFTTPDPWGFDTTQLAGARALAAPRTARPAFLDPPLPPPVEEDLRTLDDLVRFVQDPVRAFLGQRLGLRVWDDDHQLPDTIPIELDNLQRWAVGDRLLRQLLSGVDVDAAVRAEIARGTLPPGELRHDLLREVANTALAIHDLAETNGVSGSPRSVEVDVDVPVGGPHSSRTVRVVGTVPGIHGELVAHVSYSSLSPRTRLALWVRLLAVSAAAPDTPWSALGIGRRGQNGKVVRHRGLDGPDDQRAATATDLLGRLVDLHHRGMCEPLPLPCRTAEAWASAVHRGRPAAEEAATRWTGGRWPGERAEPHLVRVFGDDCGFEDLLARTPAATETGPGWPAEPTRLGRLALRLWEPILARETWR